MKKFSKILCLVLVVVMMAGLCVVGTNAAFTDADKVTYTEAVDTLTAIGVIDGMGDNTFAPAGTLTRAQACKIIAYLKDAQTFTATSTFKDTKGHWAENYIAYCAAEGIVAGVGNGKFDPEGVLTGSAWAKMLLCAMGYDATDAGMTGDTWEVGVAKLVKSRGLADGVAKFVGAASCNRETACKLAYNALWMATPTYTGGTTTTINGVTVTTGKQYVGLTGQSLQAENFSALVKTETYDDDSNPATPEVQLVDAAGYKAYKLTYKGQPVGAQTYYYYDDMTVLTYTNKVLAKTVQADAKAAGYTITAAQASAVNSASANGLTTTVYFVDGVYSAVTATNDEIVTAANIAKSLPVAQTKTKGAYVTYTITGGTYAGSYNVYSTVVDPVADKDQAVIVGEVTGKAPVLVYKDAQGIIYICEMETVTGTVTAAKTVNGTTTYTVGGTDYIVSAVTGNSVTISVGASEKGYYLDRLGNLVLDKSAASAPVYFALGYKDVNTLGDDNVITTTRYAMFVDTTGAVQQFKIGAAATVTLGDMYVTGTPDANGIYSPSTTITSANVTENTGIKGIVATKNCLKDSSWNDITSAYVNNDTLFVFAEYKDNLAASNTNAKFTVTTVTGIKNVGSYGKSDSKLSSATAIDVDKNGIYDVVYVLDNVRANATNSVAYFTGNYNLVEVKNSTYTFEYEAYVNGALTTVTVKQSSSSPASAGLREYSAIAVSGSEVTTTKVNTSEEIVKIANVGGLLQKTGNGTPTAAVETETTKTVAADCPVYVINTTDKTVNTYNFGDITVLVGTKAYITNNTANTAVTAIYLYL